MNRRERAIRLQDLRARQHRAAAAAVGLAREAEMAEVVNFCLNTGIQATEFRGWAETATANQSRVLLNVAAAMEVQVRAEAEMERQLPRELARR